LFIGLQVDYNKCILCGECIASCTFNAIKINNNKLTVNDNCTLCGICVNTCKYDALSIQKDEINEIDKSKWKGILVYVEHNNGKIHPITYELIGKALKLAKLLSYKVYCLFIGFQITESSKELSHYMVDKVFVYEDEAFKYFREDVYCNAFENCIKELMPAIVLIGGTEVGKSIASSVATRFHSGLTADCTELMIKENSDLVQIRPAFSENVMAQILTTNHRPQFATVRYKVMDEAKKLEVVRDNIINCSLDEKLLVSNIEVIKEETREYKESISEANVLVVAGQGFKTKEDLSKC